MKLKLPPAVVLVLFALLMFFCAKVLPFGYFNFLRQTYLIYFLLGLSLCIGFLAVIQFYKEKTTVDPMKPDKVSNLVTNGLYKYSRNPMYLAMLFLLVGFGLWLGNAFNSLLIAGFVHYMNKFQIFPEEEILQNHFGKAYKMYCSKVRRWF
ncbi:isoprenylcysteine carboxylmethyltransferase family protein [uncultured Maribacter sp.]|uniref:methyltransferase family protein n=1 Tax=uncultured Maribacter sp. TaxID=431308 RepID=UPI0026073613|nr:isoprenylcysteine carboxylmethyltransferase family protein [uncultured Maribacter sp.]